MSRAAGRTATCGRADAARRLADARDFLEAADLLDAPKVKATNAITAAIAAADAITCDALGQRSGDGNHKAAADLLRSVDRQLGAMLGRALDHKTQAAYQSGQMSARDAASCVRWARALIEAAEARLLGPSYVD